jgi:hypothetical protein
MGSCSVFYNAVELLCAESVSCAEWTWFFSLPNFSFQRHRLLFKDLIIQFVLRGLRDTMELQMDSSASAGSAMTSTGVIMLSSLQAQQQGQMMPTQMNMDMQIQYGQDPSYPMTPQTPMTPFGVPLQHQQPLAVDANNRPLVDVIHEACVVQVHMLEQIRQNQKALIDQVSAQIARSTDQVSLMQQAFQSILQDQANIKERIEKELNALQELNQTRILAPEELHRLYVLHQELQLQFRQLELYYYELQSLANPNVPVPYAATLSSKY